MCEAHFEVKSAKDWGVRSTFGRSDIVLRGRRKGLCTLSKVSNCSMCKNGGRRENLKRMQFPWQCAIQETCSSGPFLRRVAFWCIRSSVLGGWFCVTGATLRMTWHHFFPGRRSTLDRWSGKDTKPKPIGTRPSALHSTFHFWRKSCRIVSFLMLSTSRIAEVSQNCFAFLMLSNLRNEEVLQNCLVFDVVKFKNEEVSQNCCLFKLADCSSTNR